MKILQLLIVSPDTENINALKGIADLGRFAVMTADSDEGAVEKGCRVNFDAVIAGKGLSGEAVRKLKAVFKASSLDTVVICRNEDERGTEGIRQQLNALYLARQKERLQHITVNDTTDAKNLEGDIRVAEVK